MVGALLTELAAQLSTGLAVGAGAALTALVQKGRWVASVFSEVTVAEGKAQRQIALTVKCRAAVAVAQTLRHLGLERGASAAFR